MSAIIIVGGGHAAGQAAASLRQKGYDGRVTVVTSEAYLPYQRPPLSKAYLAGKMELEHLYLRQADFYASRDVEVRSGTTIHFTLPEG